MDLGSGYYSDCPRISFAENQKGISGLIKRESPDFAFGEMVGSNWWVALILGLLLGVLGVIVILNPLLGLGVIGVVVGCGMITAGINLIFLSTNVWLW